MAKLDDFLRDLEPGREIAISKDWITETLLGWKVRVLGLPKEGSKGQIYNGCLHAHDVGDHYCAHRDRVGPDKDPIGHLVEDAPIVIVGGLFHALIAGAFWVSSKDRIKGA